MKLLLLSCVLLPGLFAADLVRKPSDEGLYSAFGKRDPFRVPERGGLKNQHVLDPLRKYRLEGYHLRAVLRLGGKTQAMFEDPEGRSHVVREGDRIGLEGALVSRIVNSEVIVTEKASNYLGKETLLEKVLSLPKGDDDSAPASPAGSTVQQAFSGDPDRAVSGIPSGDPSKSPEKETSEQRQQNQIYNDMTGLAKDNGTSKAARENLNEDMTGQAKEDQLENSLGLQPEVMDSQGGQP